MEHIFAPVFFKNFMFIFGLYKGRIIAIPIPDADFGWGKSLI